MPSKAAIVADALHEDPYSLSLRRRLLAVFSVSAGTFLLTMDASIVYVALPNIAKALQIDNSASVLLVVIYNLVLAMTLLPFASLGERIGLDRLFRIGLLVYMVGGTLCLFANSLPVLVLLRGVQALGTAASLSVSIALVRAIYPPEQLGRGFGINTVAAVCGAAMAPAVGGFLLGIASWSWIFVVGIPMTVIALATSTALPAPRMRPEPIDLLGVLLCFASFGLIISGLEAITRSTRILIPSGVLLLGVVACIQFVRHEVKNALPILPVDLLASPAVSLSVGAAFGAVLGSTVLLLSMPFRLHDFGFSPVQIGAMLTPYAIGAGIVSPVAGILSDRFTPALLGSIGLTVAMIGVGGLIFLPEHPTPFSIYCWMGLCGVGFGMFFSPNGRLVVGSAPANRAASASSLLSTTRMFGQAMASTLLGALLGVGVGADQSAAVVAAVFTIVAVICSIARLPSRASTDSKSSLSS